MQSTFQKIKKAQPLVRFKKKRVDEESMILAAIRQEKQQIVSMMKDNQRRYMQGIENLNAIRQSKDRSNLETMEQALDFVKAEWFKLYRKVQEIEGREKQQLAQVMTAERELRSIEKLQEKYQQDLQRSLMKQEQKSLDELALRRFVRR